MAAINYNSVAVVPAGTVLDSAEDSDVAVGGAGVVSPGNLNGGGDADDEVHHAAYIQILGAITIMLLMKYLVQQHL
jgi:hypothetical protein